MTVPSKDHIVVRALLNVLDPSAEQLDACAKKPFVKLKKRGVNACAPAADDHRRVVGRPASIVVVERLSACTISVSWRTRAPAATPNRSGAAVSLTSPPSAR